MRSWFPFTACPVALLSLTEAGVVTDTLQELVVEGCMPGTVTRRKAERQAVRTAYEVCASRCPEIPGVHRLQNEIGHALRDGGASDQVRG